MTAAVEKLPVPRRYRAWCEPCQDGYQGGKPTAEKWAAQHNATRHPEPSVEKIAPAATPQERTPTP